MVFRVNDNEKIRGILRDRGIEWIGGEYTGYKSVITVRYENGHEVTRSYRRIMEGMGCICRECNREKARIGATGKIRTEEQKKNYKAAKVREKNPATGTTWKQTDEAKKKISEGKKGDKNPAWNPELTNEERKDRRNIKCPDNVRWAFEVKKRDRFECQICFINKKLASHHIEAFAQHVDKRLDVDNGICLCKTCHLSFHRTYGNKNINFDQILAHTEKRRLAILYVLFLTVLFPSR